MLNRWLSRLRHGEPVVVVSGLPRSGTSMLMAMLGAGGLTLVTDGRRAADDDNPQGYFELERVKDLENDPDKSWLRDARGKGIKVISHLLKTLPADNSYKVVFAVRDLSEVVASQNKMLRRQGDGSTSSSAADDARAIELYRKHLVNVRVLTRTRRDMEMIEINHRDTIGDPRGAAARINHFLGSRLDEAAMAAAVDARLYRNRRDETAD